MTISSIFPPTSALGALIKWEPPDDEGLHRCCYITQQVKAFLLSDAAKKPDWGRLTPARQLVSVLDGFVAGESLARLGQHVNPPLFRKMKPRRRDTGPNVWELRTTDVRLFGWFPGPPNTFVGVVATMKRELLRPDGSNDDAQYAAHIANVAAWRTQQGCDHLVWRLDQDDLPVHLKC